MKWIASLIILFLVFQVTDSKPSKANMYEATASEMGSPPGTLLRYEPLRLPPLFRAKAWRILYATRDYRGRPIASSGVVVLPDRANLNPARRTIVAWAHPTTGIARKCAPSIQETLHQSILGLNELIASGHIIAATDYPGLGTAGPIGYLVGKGQAHAVIDSVRAARKLPGVGGSNEYAAWGFSQGAHAALFAVQVNHTYAPELKIVGVAAIAPPTLLARLLRADIGSTEGRVLAAYALGSWSLKYAIPLSTIADASVISAVSRVNSNCTINGSDLLKILTAERSLQQDFFKVAPWNHPRWANVIAANSLSGMSGGTPAIIFQGSIDSIVRPEVTTEFVRNSCRNGARVKLVALKGRSHSGSARAGEAEAIRWINERFRGSPAPSSCK